MIISILLIFLITLGTCYVFYKESFTHLLGVAFSEKSFDRHDIDIVSAQSKSEGKKQIDISKSGFYALSIRSSQSVKRSDFSLLDMSFKVKKSNETVFDCSSPLRYDGYVFAKNSTDYVMAYSKPFYLESGSTYVVEYTVNNSSSIEFSLKIKRTPSP